MCDKEPLEEGYQYFGGSLNEWPSKGNKRSYWQWTLTSGKQIDYFLKNIRKYVRVKGERIDIALQYRARLSKKMAELNISGRRMLTNEELNLRNGLEFKLKLLNKRGNNEEKRHLW